MAKYVVARIDEIPPGTRKIVDVAGRQIGVFNIKGEYFALRNRCPHQGGPLCEGQLSGLLEASVPGEFSYSRSGEILHCPWHGWEYDIRNGQSYFDPRSVRVRSYDVQVQGGPEVACGAAVQSAPTITTIEGPGTRTSGVSGIVKGPFKAETYEVSVDAHYVMVELTGP